MSDAQPVQSSGEPTPEPTSQPVVTEPQGQDPDKESQEQPEPKPDKFSRQHKVYLKQQTELRQKQQAFEQERNEHQTQLEKERADLAQYRHWKEEIDNGNPWAFLKANKWSLERLESLARQDAQDPKLVAMNVAKDLEKKFEERFSSIEKKRQDEVAQLKAAQFEGLKKTQLQNAARILQSDSERFELSNARDDSSEIILHIMANRFQEDPDNPVWVNNPEAGFLQAADLLESHLEQNEIRDNPIFKTGKAKKYFLDADNEVVKQDKNKSASRSSERRKQASRANQSKNEPRTVQNKMSSVSNAVGGKETFAERKERLIREWENGTFRPKAEYTTR